MFWGDHNPSANGAVTPYNGSDSPSGGSSRRAGLAGVGTPAAQAVVAEMRRLGVGADG